jgi:membrane-bound lytic murein transglycosylase B
VHSNIITRLAHGSQQSRNAGKTTAKCQNTFPVNPWFDQELKDARKARKALKANPDATQDDIKTADRKFRSLRRSKEKAWAFNNVPPELLWPPADSARISGWLRKRLQRQYELQSAAVEGLD